MATFTSLDTFNDAPLKNGTSRNLMTGSEEFLKAELCQIDDGHEIEDAVAPGTDCYLFVYDGLAQLSSDGKTFDLAKHATAVLGEGASWKVKAKNGPCKIILVTASAGSESLEGLKEKCRVIDRADLPLLPVPEQKKVRHYIAGKESIFTKRAHAMIVDYVPDTLTPMHHHPNADSIFVVLEGGLKFKTPDTTQAVSSNGVAIFKAGDKHSVLCGDGFTNTSFLEFHIPGGFTTIRE